MSLRMDLGKPFVYCASLLWHQSPQMQRNTTDNDIKGSLVHFLFSSSAPVWWISGLVFFFFFWIGGGEQQYFWCSALCLRRRRRRTVLWAAASQCLISERNIQNIIHCECMRPDFITTPKAELTHVLIVIMRLDLAIYHFTAAQKKNDLENSASSHVGFYTWNLFSF